MTTKVILLNLTNSSEKLKKSYKLIAKKLAYKIIESTQGISDEVRIAPNQLNRRNVSAKSKKKSKNTFTSNHP